MHLLKLQPLPDSELSEKVKEQYSKLETLLLELEQRQLPEDVIKAINKEIEQVNSRSPSVKDRNTFLYKGRSGIIQILENELELVPRNHYRNRWLALGMAAFGIPFGTIFSISLDNFGFIGLGLPIGMALGISIGTSLDKKAQENGKQLDFDNK